MPPPRGIRRQVLSTSSSTPWMSSIEKSQSQLLKYLKAHFASPRKANFVLTSQPHPGALKLHEDPYRLQLQSSEELIDQDVANFIDSRLLEIEVTTGQVIELKTSRAHKQRAWGNFQWASFTLDLLEGKISAGQEAIQQVLSMMPEGLTGVYERYRRHATQRKGPGAKIVYDALGMMLVSRDRLLYKKIGFLLAVKETH